VSYSVVQRTHEIGIRAALGAGAGEILRLILRGGMLMTAAGLALGLVGALGIARLLKALLFGVGSWDPLTVAAAGLLLAAAALVACYLPALRASRVDPVTALRSE
jgi:putative ABC transport system permease protein